MRILLDEQLPRQLARYFVGHDVRTTQEQGSAGPRNGVLLKYALAAAFEDGERLQKIARFGGHSSTNVTETFYAHLHPEHLKRAAGVIDSVLPGS